MDNSSPGLFEPNSGWPNTYLLIRGLFAVANAAIFTLDAALWRGNRYDSLLSQLGELLRSRRRILNRKGSSSNRSMEADNALVGKIRYKLREQGRQEGRQVGREEQAREDSAWYERMQAALKRGEDFDEPPPWQKR